MNIVVLVKLVPDLVEEIEIDSSGTAVDTTFMRLMLNEFDEHAIEQAMLLSSRVNGQVTVIAPDYDGADDVLFTAVAKGADRIIKLMGDFEGEVNSHALARSFHALLQDLSADLILTGVQAHDSLDGPVGALVAAEADLPYVGYVSGVSLEDNKCSVKKEYPGGLIAEMEVELPAVLGIQAAEEPPRYIAISKIRQAMKVATIEEVESVDLDTSGGPFISRMYLRESGERATMLEGDEGQVATQIVEIFKERGIF
jgi:electron transfer flavoprotein beta subunit